MLTVKFYDEGISLLEILIAAFLSIFILCNLLLLFVSLKSSWSYQAALARIEENMLLAADFLNQDVTQAGYHGCNRIEDIFLQIHHKTNFEFSADKKIQLIKKENLPTDIQKIIAPESDIFLITKSTKKISYLLKPMNDQKDIYLTDNYYKKGEVIEISDCVNADVFTIEKIAFHKSGATISAPQLNHFYKENSQIAVVEQIIYFVGKANDDYFALFRKDLLTSHESDEIIAGVNKMKMKINPNNSININLLFDSLDSISSKPTAYTFQGKKYYAENGHLLKEWNSTLFFWQN